MKKDKIDCRNEVFGKQDPISHKIKKHGDVSKKIAIMLSDNKTTIFVSDRNNIQQTKERYEKRINSIRP